MQTNAAPILYRLPPSNRRAYDIQVTPDTFLISGNFYLLGNQEFSRGRTQFACARISDFLGMGYLAERSYRKTVLFAAAGTALGVIDLLISQINQFTGKADETLQPVNDILQYTNQEIHASSYTGGALHVLNIILHILTVLCIICGIALLFSKKKMIEISFTTKRLCVPQKSMTQSEFQMLYQAIITIRKNNHASG